MFWLLFLPFFGYVVSGQELYGSVDVCAPLDQTSTELRLLDMAFECIIENPDSTTPKHCKSTSECLSNAIINMTLSVPCENYNQDESATEHSMLNECKPATIVFILVETLRKYMASAVIENPSVSCERRSLLLKLVAVCAPEESNQGSLAGYDLLARLVSKEVGNLEPIASEMKSMLHKRLWQGAFVIAFTFACPGILAVFSPQHIQIVTSLQLLSTAVIFLYIKVNMGYCMV